MRYTREDKEKIKQKILEIAKGHGEVCGVILVGSSANNKGDEYSDLDISIVVSEEGKTEEVWKKINAEVKTALKLVFLYENTYAENNYLSVTFMENFLEVDLGVISLDLLEARRPDWEIIFDRDGSVLKKMQETSNPESDKIKFDEEFINVNLTHALYHTRNFLVALRRGRLFRAMKEIEDFRNNLIDLVGDQEGLATKHYREVDKFAEDTKVDLAKCYAKSIDEKEIRGVYLDILGLFFKRMERMNQEMGEINRVKDYVYKMVELY